MPVFCVLDGLEMTESSSFEPKLSSLTPTGDTTVTAVKEIKKIDVFTLDFVRVETPFLIGMWIFCASIAKIGKLPNQVSYIFSAPVLLKLSITKTGKFKRLVC